MGEPGSLPFFLACFQSLDAQQRPESGDRHRNQRDSSFCLVPKWFPHNVVSLIEAESRYANDGNNDHTNTQAKKDAKRDLLLTLDLNFPEQGEGYWDDYVPRSGFGKSDYQISLRSKSDVISNRKCVMPDAMFLVKTRPVLHSTASSQVLWWIKSKIRWRRQSLLTSSRAKVRTTDKNCTCADSTKKFRDSRCYFPG